MTSLWSRLLAASMDLTILLWPPLDLYLLVLRSLEAERGREGREGGGRGGRGGGGEGEEGGGGGGRGGREGGGRGGREGGGRGLCVPHILQQHIHLHLTRGFSLQ